jgi:hypothetical protein
MDFATNHICLAERLHGNALRGQVKIGMGSYHLVTAGFIPKTGIAFI